MESAALLARAVLLLRRDVHVRVVWQERPRKKTGDQLPFTSVSWMCQGCEGSAHHAAYPAPHQAYNHKTSACPSEEMNDWDAVRTAISVSSH